MVWEHFQICHVQRTPKGKRKMRVKEMKVDTYLCSLGKTFSQAFVRQKEINYPIKAVLFFLIYFTPQ